MNDFWRKVTMPLWLPLLVLTLGCMFMWDATREIWREERANRSVFRPH